MRSFRKQMIEFYKKQAQIMEKTPRRTIELAQTIDKFFPKSVKLFEVSDATKYPFLKENQFAIVLFHTQMPHRPIPVIVDFDENDRIVAMTLFDEKGEKNRKKVEEKTGDNLTLALNLINAQKYKPFLEIAINKYILSTKHSLDEKEREFAEKLERTLSTIEEKERFLDRLLYSIVRESDSFWEDTLERIKTIFTEDDYRKTPEDIKALSFLNDMIKETCEEITKKPESFSSQDFFPER